MAQNQANFGLNFRVDKSGLNELKKSLQDIMRLGQKNSATGTMTKELEEACKAARQLETILDGAWNSKLGQLNLDKVNQGIKTTYHSVEELQTALGKTPQGQAAFNKMASQVLNTNLQLKQTNKLLDDMATSMANTVKWGITSSIFNNMTRSVQDAFYYVKNLDSSLNDIRIVTGASADQMAAFAEKANTAAKALGQSTRAYTDASLIYYQQGLSEQDVAARAETTLKAANVTGQNTEEVSELLTSVWNGYKVSAAEAELYIDKIAAVAATTASDLEELSVGMSKVASAASLMGVDIDQLNAQLATIVSVTRQAPESVGTALKTIYARMGDIEAGLDGETTLGNYTEQMKEMGFNVLDAQGKLRDMGSVIEEIGAKWSNMTREQQLSLAQTVAGTRQYNNLLALFDNWDMYTGALNTSATAMGTLQEQQDIYMESTKAHLQQLSTEAEKTYSTLLDTNVINGFSDSLTGVLGQFNDFIDGIGGGTNAIVNLGSVIANVFHKQIGNAISQQIQNFNTWKSNIEGARLKDTLSNVILGQQSSQGAEKELLRIEETIKMIQSSTGEGVISKEALRAEAEIAQQILHSKENLTQEEYNQLTAVQSRIGKITEEITYLESQKQIFESRDQSEDELNQDLEKQIQLRKTLIQQQQTISQLYTKNIDFGWEDETEQRQLLLNIEKQIAAIRSSNVDLGNRLNTINTLESTLKDKNLSTEQKIAAVKQFYNTLLGAQNVALQGVKGEEEKIQKIVEAIRAIDSGRLTDLNQQNQSLKQQVQEYLKIANQGNRIGQTIQKVTGLLQAATAVAGGLQTAFQEGASSTERLNGYWSAAVGGLSGVVNAFLPGVGTIVSLVGGLGKSILEATGWWDEWADKLKSTEEKIAEIDEAIKTIGQSESQTSSQISSLKAIEEEYALLSQKAGQYGQNLDSMTEAEQARYTELTTAFTQYNDAVILGYDSQGRAIVNNQTAIKETIELLQRQHEEEARARLGNVSKGLAAKDQAIADAEIEKNQYLPFGIKQQFGNERLANAQIQISTIDSQLKKLDDDAKKSIINVQGVEYTVSDLVDRIDNISMIASQTSTPINVSELEFTIEGLKSLTELFNESSNFAEIDKRGTKRDKTSLQVFEQFQEDNPLESVYNYINDYEETVKNAAESLNTADQHLQELKNFDVNYIMDVLRYGEGYDDQWDSLSDQGKDIGYNLLVQYLDGITYGAAQGQADSYAEIVTMGQNFIVGLNTAMEQGFKSIQLAADSFNQEQLDSEVKMTFEERANAIKEIIAEEISKIENFEGLDTNVKEALELIFENAFNVDLDLDESGNINEFVDRTAAYLDDAKYQIEQAAQKNLVEGDVQIDFLQGLFDQGSLNNVNAIIQNIDWSSVRAGTLSLTEAIAQAVEESKSLISQLREEAQLGETILSKLKNKEELEDSEASYLSKLEAENEVLNGLIRGTDEYNQALAELIATKKKDFNDQLNTEVGRINSKIQAEQDDNTNLRAQQAQYEEGSSEYEEIEALIKINDQEIENYQSYLSNLKYEIFCLVKVEADPDIASQIRNLYNDADTLISIRATLENDEALSEEQTDAFGSFLSSDNGQSYLEEFANTGVITEDMLVAAEEYAKGLESNAEGFRESIQNTINELLMDAEEAEKAGNFDEADNYRMQAAQQAAEAAQIDSERNEKKENDFDTEMKSFGLESDEVEDLADSIQDMAESSDELADSLEDDEKAAKEIAKEIKRYDNALESVKDNYEDWMDALESDNIELQAEAIDDMDKAYSDLLDLDYGTLSDEFLTNAENLELMREAANGSEDAYNQLQSLAQQDILTHCRMNVDDFNAASAKVQSQMDAMNFEDIEVGASLDNTAFLSALTDMVNATSMTAEQATNYLASMGIDAEVVEDTTTKRDVSKYTGATARVTTETVDGTDPLTGEDKTFTIPSITYEEAPMQVEGEKEQSAFALKVTSANKGSGGGFKHSNSKAGGSPSGGGKGGGGKGGGGKGKAVKKPKARKKDYYHNVNNSLTKLGNQYDKLAEQQDKTFGQKHIDNIKKTNENLDKQIDKMRERIKIANEQEKKDLKKDITKNYKDVKFNKDGTIKNYENILAKYYKKYENAKSQESQDKAKEKYDKLKELLDEYETLILETIPGWEAEVREKIDEKYENMVHQFEYEIEMRVNWGDSVREVREFFHEISDYSEDFKNIASFNFDQATSYFDSNEITSRTRQLSDALGELDKINAANAKGYKITNKDEEKYFSDIWGDNKEGLMDYIATLQTDLMDAILNIQDSRDDAYDAYLDAIDEGIDKMDRHLEQYEIINEQLEHNRNLVELIYGETSDQLANIYAEQRNVQLEQIKGQKNAADMYYERMIDAQNRLNKETKGTDRYKEIEEEVEQFTDQYNEAISNVNATVEESIELIISKYEYAVQQIFKNINNDLLNTSVMSATDPLNNLQIESLEEASLHWDLLNQEAEQYLDATNSTFEIQKLEAKYLDALNQTDNLKAQQKISDVMNEQISMLEKKDELSQYEVDRANLIYDLTLKQIALEEAQQNKSKMRLRRDAQGNYSYQFTADADLIKQTQQELLDVQQQLYNLDKDNYQSQLNEMYGYYVEWQEKLAEVAMIKDVDERNRTAALVNDYYTKLMQNANDQAQIAKTNLDELVEGPLADFYKANEDIAIGPNGLSSMYESALSVLSEKFSGEDGISNQVQTAWEDITKKAEIYKEELDAIESASGKAFDKLSTDEELNKITGGIGDITTATEALGKEWKTVLDSISEFVTKLDTLLKDEKIEKAKEVIKESEKVEIDELKTSGDAAEKANIMAVADPVPEPTKTTTTATNDNKDKEDKKDDKNKNKNKTKTIKKGGKINAKGAKIYDAPGGTGKTQYYKNDPKYKVLKISGNWVQARYHKLSSGVSGWFKKSAVKALNTGGYTGDWNSNEGRIALLHKKELVLNQKDTKNILDAVNIIRGLGGLLQNSMVSRIEGLTQSLNGISIPTVQNNPETGPQSVEQTVHITAEFPGATEVIQIEQALENLVSRASQYAFRRKE